MKKLLSFILALSLMICMVPVVSAANDEATEAAEALYELGLFRGTGTNPDGTPIFELDKTPTRNQAVIMLVRLLGKEKEALAGNWELPFTDVAKSSTAYPYIGYAYANGLTNGTSTTTYGGTNLIKANQYITFVLRALGYTSGKDFSVSTAWEFSDKIGLTHGEYNATKQFTRGDISVISLSALSTMVYHSERTLVEELVSENAISIQSAVSAGLIVWKGDPYLWGVTMQCDEVIYDHEADCWPVSSSKEETKLTIKAIGKDQYHRPFDVNPKNGFFWGLTDSFEKSKERDIQTQLNGVSIECDKNDPSTAVVTIPPNTDTEVWVYAGARRGQDFIRYPYLMKITPEGAVDYRAWYEVDDNRSLYIDTNITCLPENGYSTFVLWHFEEGDTFVATASDYSSNVKYHCLTPFMHNSVGNDVAYADFVVLDSATVGQDFYTAYRTSGSIENAIDTHAEHIVFHTTLHNRIVAGSMAGELEMLSFSIDYDNEANRESYMVSVNKELDKTGEYSLIYHGIDSSKKFGMSYLKKQGQILTNSRTKNNFGNTGETGQFYVMYFEYSMMPNGELMCNTLSTKRINYTFE